MCGIAGIVDFVGNRADSESIVKMIKTLSHRGPDDEGVYVENGVAGGTKSGDSVKSISLGHKRLKIIDLSNSARQPLSNENDTIWLVCNGEIYNHKELRKGLESKGHKFKSDSDSEIIIHLYEDCGDGFISQLRGMFAFGLWDKNRKKLIIVRDRVGIKPLYYYYKNGLLLFASEIKAILSNKEVKKEIDIFALNQFLSFLYVPAPRTIFKDIAKVMPGCAIIIENGKLIENKYWDLEINESGVSRNGIRRSEEDYTNDLYDLLEESIKVRMMSDVPLGAFLSGGIDSSTIVAIMSKLSSTPVKTFSIGFGKDERFYDELKFAKVVADKFHTDHREFVVRSDIVNLLPTVIGHFDEPFANPTAILMYLLSEETKKHVSVALSGTGGDEAFSGYTRYVGMKMSEYAQMVPFSLRKMLTSFAGNIPESSNGRHIGRRLRTFLNGTLLPPEERYRTWVSVFQEEVKRELFVNSHADVQELEGYNGSHSYLNPYLTKLGISSIHDRVFYTDVKTYLPNNQLEYVDKTSMAHALEVRVPFCDHKLLEFAATIPYKMKIKGMNTKYLLKKAVSKVLPEDIINRKKVGFNAPVGIWFQGDLNNFVKEALSESNLKRTGYFNHKTVNAIVGEHNAKRKDYSLHIWALLVFQVWHDAYMN